MANKNKELHKELQEVKKLIKERTRKSAKKIRVFENNKSINYSISIPKEVIETIPNFENIWYSATTDGKNITFISGCMPEKIKASEYISKHHKWQLSKTFGDSQLFL